MAPVYGYSSTIKEFTKSDKSQLFSNNMSNKKFMTNISGQAPAPSTSSYESLIRFMPTQIEKGMYAENNTVSFKATNNTTKPASTPITETANNAAGSTIFTTQAPKATPEAQKSVYDINPSNIQNEIAQSNTSKTQAQKPQAFAFSA